jgi:hypothetical protein
VVYVPELKSCVPTFEQFEKDGYTFSTFFTGDEKFECILKTGNQTVPLLSWDKGEHDSNTINPKVARRLDGFDKMSGNDQLALCTSLKLAKPGCYLLTQTNYVTTQRRLVDFKFSADLTKEEVNELWGPPDGHRGSGVDYVAYRLEDGQEVWINFLPDPPHQIHGAILVSAAGRTKLIYSSK